MRLTKISVTVMAIIAMGIMCIVQAKRAGVAEDSIGKVLTVLDVCFWAAASTLLISLLVDMWRKEFDR